MSFIQPMFHFRLKPSPPTYVGRETLGQAVDSSAIGQHARMMLVRQDVEFLDERNGFEILAAAEFVGNPFARLAAVVEIQHRGDGIDPQAVDVIFVEPEQGVGEQEIAHFGAAVVEDQRAPVGMLALAAGSACS